MRCCEGRTAMLIAHRSRPPCGPTASWSSTTGESLELGTHDELVALGGHYAEMYATWMEHLGGDDLVTAGPVPSHG